jgi:hypothetical protein
MPTQPKMSFMQMVDMQPAEQFARLINVRFVNSQDISYLDVNLDTIADAYVWYTTRALGAANYLVAVRLELRGGEAGLCMVVRVPAPTSEDAAKAAIAALHVRYNIKRVWVEGVALHSGGDEQLANLIKYIQSICSNQTNTT